MKTKGVLMAGVALIMCGTINSAEANDRLSLYEVNNFVAQLTNAINNPDPLVGRAFLQRNITTSATFSDTLNTAWADGRYAYNGYYNGAYAYQAYNGYNTSPYYRYPNAYNGYVRASNHKAVGKSGLIAQIEHKKSVIPRYHQTISILGTRMPADASSVTVDVNLREFGLSYAMSPYGIQHGQKVEHSNARCQLNLTKNNGDIQMNRMTCNTVAQTPFL